MAYFRAIGAQGLGRGQHVGAFQLAVNGAFADAQRAQDQGSVRDRFIAGHGNLAPQAGAMGYGGMNGLDGHSRQLPIIGGGYLKGAWEML